MSAGRVALTFDAEHPDRPTTAGVLESILETLATLTVRASFFLQGRWVENRPDLAARIAQCDHLIGSHSFYHVRMPLLTASGFRSDVRNAERAIIKATGINPRPYFRCPFGVGAGAARTRRLLDELGYRDIGWHVEAHDWDSRRTAAMITTEVVDKVARHRGNAIVLLHSWPQSTGEALPTIVSELRQRDFDFVDVAELGDR